MTVDSLRPVSSHYYPLLDPPNRQGYRLELYNQLIADSNMMVYEIRKPGELIPYTIVIRDYEDHLAFFHTLWNMDEFDTCAADRHFMMRVWHHLCPHHGPWQPALYDICIDEEFEPIVYRMAAPILLMEQLYLSETKGIKLRIGRFCVVFILCLSLVSLSLLILVH